MNKWLKYFSGLLLALLIIAIFSVIIFYFILKSKIPEYTVSLPTNDIKQNVEIYYDENGIPYIYAQTEPDIAFSMGYLHAQNRLFQMDIVRRAAEGRLSEIFGTKVLSIDKMFRTYYHSYDLKSVIDNLSSQSELLLNSYAKGVNQYIKEAKGNYQIEFDVLGYEPEYWKPEHSLLIAKMMSWSLNISWWTDLTYTYLAQKLGNEKAMEIIPDWLENAPTIIPDYSDTHNLVISDFISTNNYARNFLGFRGTHIGSNSWAVNSNKSASGKIIIANDPHLFFTLPEKWYIISINSPDWNSQGFSFPGIPAIVIGRNKDIAWGMTNVMADDCDFYFESLDSTQNNYLLDNKWLPLDIIRDTILVRDSSNVIIDIKKTHRGPIISDIHENIINYENEVLYKSSISMKWTAFEKSDELFAMYAVSKSKNWKEFQEALRYFHSPGQNFIYADKDNNLGYVCAAKLPIRRNNSTSFVYDGSKSENDWIGFVPYEEMPKLFNPTENFIASANNKTINDFKYHISNLWEPKSRIERITELLKSKEKLSESDFKKFQLDIVSPYARELVKHITRAFENVKIKDDNLRISLDLLKKWNYEFAKDSQTPTIYTRFLQKILENIYKDEMELLLFNQYIFVANVPYRNLMELLEKENSNWFDNIRTERIEDKNFIIRKSLIDALIELEKEMGKDLTYWQWGKIHKVSFKHIFSLKYPSLGKFINIGPASVGGDGTTIYNTEYLFTNPYESVLGPSMRYIYDFSNSEYMNVILPTGQSGVIMSEHYDNLFGKWLNGEYVELLLNDNKIKNSNFKKFEFIKEK